MIVAIFPGGFKTSLCSRGDVGRPISANMTPENLLSDQVLKMTPVIFIETHRNSLIT